MSTANVSIIPIFIIDDQASTIRGHIYTYTVQQHVGLEFHSLPSN